MQELIFDKNRKRVKYCPCGKKNTNGKFVPYKNHENKGYCFSCDKTFLPKLDKGDYIKPEFNYKPPLPISYHNPNLIIQSGRNYKENNFIQFLKTLFSETKVKEIIKKYLIGTSKHWQGATVFWQIDNYENIRYGKIMLYDTNGKRKKDKNEVYISNVRSVLKLKNFNLKQCLFGLHLINETNSKTIAIVESEKTAIIMSLFKPEYVWLATGSKQGFKYEFLKELKNYNIIAFPDKSEYDDWFSKAIDLISLGFSIKISEWLENINVSKGTDLADIYIESVLNIEKINNQIQTVKTNTECLVEKMAIKNPVIIQLIKTFDLVDKNNISINTEY